MMLTSMFAERIAATQFVDLPSDVVAAALDALTDTIGVMLGGAAMPVVVACGDALALPPGPCRIVGSIRTAGVADAAMMNGMAAHALGMDATSHTFIGHPLVQSVGALLALADMVEANGTELIAAFVAGYETATRLARMVQPRHTQRGWSPTSTIGMIGAAGAAARLMRLDASRTAIALGTAAQLACGLMASAWTPVRAISAGHAARGAVTAGLLARERLGGAPDIVEVERGFLDMFGDGVPENAQTIIAAFGDPWDITELATGKKRHPTSGVLQAATDVACLLHDQIRSNSSAIRAIEIRMLSDRAMGVDRDNPRSGGDGKFSAQYCVARALIQGRLRIEDFTNDAVADPAVRALMARTKVIRHPDADPAAARRDQAGAEIQLTFADGTILIEARRHAIGRAPGEPMPRAMIDAKFRDAAARTLSPARIDTALNLLDELPTIRIGALLDVLAGANVGEKSSRHGAAILV